ncbi:ATP-binding protein [Paenibacillus abyssi]
MRAKSIVSGIAGSILVILCMTFPITIIDNHMFDLRQIPLIIGFFYVSRTTGVIIFISLIIARSYWGGEGFYGALFVNSCLIIALFFVRSKFNSLPVHYKFLLTTLLTLFSSILINLYFILVLQSNAAVVLLITSELFVVQSIGLFIIIYSIEKLKRDAIIEMNLHKSEKAKIVSELAAAVSHEIRNPLTVTKGFLQIVTRQPLPEITLEHLRMAQEELIHAENVINDYLTFAKPALDNPTSLHVALEMNKIVKFITPYANMQSVQLNLSYDKELIVTGEPQKFHQCISNLLKNAIEAMPNGGKIDIKMAQADSKMMLIITDTGIGMTPNELQRLGEPYFSTKEKGTGLGMMVVFGIIRSMGGRIHATSEKGKGTTFTIELPLENQQKKNIP